MLRGRSAALDPGPPDRGYALSVGRLCPGLELGQRLVRDRHVQGGRMDHGFGVERDGDVLGEEDQVAAFDVGFSLQRLAEVLLLHVGIAQGEDAGPGQGDLDQGRAVQADAAAPAPEVGRAEEGARGSDVVGRGLAQGRQVTAEDPAAAGQAGETLATSTTASGLAMDSRSRVGDLKSGSAKR